MNNMFAPDCILVRCKALKEQGNDFWGVMNHLVSQSECYLGLDLGGTKIEAVVLNQAGERLFCQRLPTPQGDYLATLTAIDTLVQQADQQFGLFAAIGIGTPGAISTLTHRMKNCNSTCLNDQPLLQDLESRLNRTVFLANDADCFALSEAVDGAGQGAQSVFGVILGTGVGGGLVLNGRLLQGVNRIAGEWGHNLMPETVRSDWPDRACYCGRLNCVETFLSGAGLRQTYQQHCQMQSVQYASVIDHSVMQTVPEIVVRAEQGEACAQQALRLYAEQLAAALATVINIVDPEVIVLGGGLSNIQMIYSQLSDFLPKFVFSDQVLTQIKAPKYGDSSGVRGAAWLAL